MKATLAALLCAATLVTVSACTSSKATSGEGSPIASVGVTSPTSEPTDTVTPTTDTQSPTPATSSASPTATKTTTKPPAHSNNTCAFDQLGIRTLTGSGDLGREYAAVMFTNTGTKTCTMYGFPGISLRHLGKPLAQPASRDLSQPLKIIRLNPGDRAQAEIVAVSTCQTPLSDMVRIYPPDSTKFVDRDLVLRGCTLTVKPITAS